ncbi:MAG TPA: signal recognition particle-docking protein FtsY, partial [Pirellulales bacterium]|nr:signal recognition particle-docking protein FtsY [Pirellulales bacterium]
VEQLTIWAERLGAEIVRGDAGGDPASVAHRAVSRTIETKADVCIIDTAGRLQTQRNLMAELEKIRRVVSKQIPAAPHEVLLVLDATTGQNGLSQAKHFTEAVACTGIVLAKIDGTAKGGVVVAIRKQMGLPVKFLGVGEQADDLTVFDASSFVDVMFEDAVLSADSR